MRSATSGTSSKTAAGRVPYWGRRGGGGPGRGWALRRLPWVTPNLRLAGATPSSRSPRSCRSLQRRHRELRFDRPVAGVRQSRVTTGRSKREYRRRGTHALSAMEPRTLSGSYDTSGSTSPQKQAGLAGPARQNSLCLGSWSYRALRGGRARRPNYGLRPESWPGRASTTIVLLSRRLGRTRLRTRVRLVQIARLAHRLRPHGLLEAHRATY